MSWDLWRGGASLLSPPATAGPTPLAGLSTRSGDKHPLQPFLPVPSVPPPPLTGHSKTQIPALVWVKGQEFPKPGQRGSHSVITALVPHKALREPTGKEGTPGAFDLTLPQSHGNLATISNLHLQMGKWRFRD